jgi:hypothetical protein
MRTPSLAAEKEHSVIIELVFAFRHISPYVNVQFLKIPPLPVETDPYWYSNGLEEVKEMGLSVIPMATIFPEPAHLIVYFPSNSTATPGIKVRVTPSSTSISLTIDQGL